MDLPKADDLKALVSALAPGLIILGIREPFLAVPDRDLSTKLIKYAAVSSVYYALAHPLLTAVEQRIVLQPWAAQAIEYVVAPAALGLLAAIAVRNEWPFKFWRLVRMKPKHPVPSAWDYVFSHLKSGKNMIVTLSDGSQVCGFYAGDGSFASTDREERDLLLANVWDFKRNKWVEPTTPKSVLICGRDIRHIEFFEE